MIEMLPCAIGSIPGVGSHGMSSGTAGESEPAKVSPSPPGKPGVAHVEEEGLRLEERLGQPTDEARELRSVRQRSCADADDVGVEHLAL